MGYKIISYKMFLNALCIVGDIVIVLLILKKVTSFTTLSPKIVFEETQMICSLLMQYGALMSYFVRNV